MDRSRTEVYKGVKLPRLRYLGGEAIALAGDPVLATLPQGTEVVQIAAEGGILYFSINTPNANTNSSGFVPQNGVERLPVLFNLYQLSLYADQGVTARILYFDEVRG